MLDPFLPRFWCQRDWSTDGIRCRQAKALQQTLSDIVEQVESIRTEHDKLESGNNFLQSYVSRPLSRTLPSPRDADTVANRYIGDLMAASKITSTSSSSKASKGKSRGLK